MLMVMPIMAAAFFPCLIVGDGNWRFYALSGLIASIPPATYRPSFSMIREKASACKLAAPRLSLTLVSALCSRSIANPPFSPVKS